MNEQTNSTENRTSAILWAQTILDYLNTDLVNTTGMSQDAWDFKIYELRLLFDHAIQDWSLSEDSPLYNFDDEFNTHYNRLREYWPKYAAIINAPVDLAETN